MLTVNEIVIKVVGFKVQGLEDWHDMVIVTLRKDHPKLYGEYNRWINNQEKYRGLTGFASASAANINVPFVHAYKKQAKIIEILKKHCTLQNVEL